mgnify:CR=1 FL=1
MFYLYTFCSFKLYVRENFKLLDSPFFFPYDVIDTGHVSSIVREKNFCIFFIHLVLKKRNALSRDREKVIRYLIRSALVFPSALNFSLHLTLVNSAY